MSRCLVVLLALAFSGCSLFQDERPPQSSRPREIGVNQVPKDAPSTYQTPGVNSKQGVVWREDEGYGHFSGSSAAAPKASRPPTVAEKARDASRKLSTLPDDLLAQP